MRRSRMWPIVLLFLSFLVTSPSKGSAQLPLIVANSAPLTLFDWEHSECSKSYTLDTPLRAFRDYEGKIRAFATQDDNWSLIGPTLMMLKADCSPTMSQASYARRTLGKLWIEATYTLDGKYIYALTSEDLTEQVKKSGCSQGGHGSNCWLSRIGYASSDDGGAHFFSSTETVVGSGSEYNKQTMGRQGYFTTSNVVRSGDFYFFLSYQQGVGDQVAGNCLFRNTNLAKPKGWTVWDGQSFVGLDQPKQANNKRCDPIGLGRLLGEVRSLTYLPTSKVWIALFGGPTKPKRAGDSAIYYSTSPDLVQWSSATLLLQPSRQEAEKELFMYPALLDPQSASRNFDTIDHSSARLLVVKLRKGAAGMHALNRKLDSYQVKLSN